MKTLENDNCQAAGGGGSHLPWIPSYVEESSGGTKEVLLASRHLTDRKVFLTGEVTEEMAESFVSQMLYLSQSDEPVSIILSSPGGSVNAGLVIYDAIQAARFPIDIYAVGMAASMGAVILAGGQKGHRFILPHSKVMIHEPLILGGPSGSATSVKKTADDILATKALLNGILAKHTGKTTEEIDEATGFDNYMSAEEAIAFGLCDEIRTPF